MYSRSINVSVIYKQLYKTSGCRHRSVNLPKHNRLGNISILKNTLIKKNLI